MDVPVVLLNNADGFNKQQMNNLNSMLLSQKKRWLKKRVQAEIDSDSITAGISQLSGVLSISTPYCSNKLLYAHGYIRLGSVSSDWTRLFKCNSNIKGFCVTGNSSEAVETNKDISLYLNFKSDGEYLLASKLQESTEVFEVTITAVME